MGELLSLHLTLPRFFRMLEDLIILLTLSRARLHKRRRSKLLVLEKRLPRFVMQVPNLRRISLVLLEELVNSLDLFHPWLLYQVWTLVLSLHPIPKMTKSRTYNL